MLVKWFAVVETHPKKGHKVRRTSDYTRTVGRSWNMKRIVLTRRHTVRVCLEQKCKAKICCSLEDASRKRLELHSPKSSSSGQREEEVSIEQSQVRPPQIPERGATQAHVASLEDVATELRHIARGMHTSDNN
jgi:hypothetical protein